MMVVKTATAAAAQRLDFQVPHLEERALEHALGSKASARFCESRRAHLEPATKTALPSALDDVDTLAPAAAKGFPDGARNRAGARIPSHKTTQNSPRTTSRQSSQPVKRKALIASNGLELVFCENLVGIIHGCHVISEDRAARAWVMSVCKLLDRYDVTYWIDVDNTQAGSEKAMLQHCSRVLVLITRAMLPKLLDVTSREHQECKAAMHSHGRTGESTLVPVIHEDINGSNRIPHVPAPYVASLHPTLQDMMELPCVMHDTWSAVHTDYEANLMAALGMSWARSSESELFNFLRSMQVRRHYITMKQMGLDTEQDVWEALPALRRICLTTDDLHRFAQKHCADYEALHGPAWLQQLLDPIASRPDEPGSDTLELTSAEHHFQKQHFKVIARALQAAEQLRKFRMSRVRAVPGSFSCIISALSTACTLMTLELDQCSLVTNDYVALATFLSRSMCLEALSVRGCKGDSLAIELLCAGVASSCSLSTLNLRQNTVTLKAIQALIAREQAGTDVRNKPFPVGLFDEGAFATSDKASEHVSDSAKRSDSALKQSQRLVRLTLSETGLHADCGRVLGEMLATLTALQDLSLSGNLLRDRGLQALVSSFQRTHAGQPLQLRSLRLASCGIKGLGSAALARLLPAMPRLEHLAIQSNNIAGDGGNALLRAVRGLHSLQVFKYHGDEIEEHVAHAAVEDVHESSIMHEQSEKSGDAAVEDVQDSSSMHGKTEGSDVAGPDASETGT